MMRLIYLTVFVFLTVFCRNVLSEKTDLTSGSKILNIIVRNNKIPVAFAEKFNCRKGKECSYQQLNRDIHNLMNLGCFENVIVKVVSTNHGALIIYSFIDSPIVAFWSNTVHNCKSVPSARLFSTKAGKCFNPADWFNDKKKLEDFYHKKNYHNVKIDSKEKRRENKITLFTDVFPGNKLFVEKITFSNASVTDDEKSDILSLMHCKPRNLWLFRRGIFSPEKFKDDEEKITDYFINRGFLDAKINVSMTNAASPNRVTINVNVIKGPQYRFGKLIWNQQLLSTENFKTLKEKFDFPSNTAYTPELPKIIRKIINKYCVKFSPLQPYLSIIPIVSNSSEPNHPIIDIIITLRKSRIGVPNFDYKTLSFSYPASLANDYLNK